MKKLILNYSFLALLAGLVILSSCSKDEERPLPVSTADFEVTSVFPEVHVPVTFENRSLNAAYYVWEYGDGDIDSASTISTSHVYDIPGNYTVKLRAYNEDGVFEESQKVVYVGERFLTGLTLWSFPPTKPDGEPWDNGESGPDVVILLGPDADPSGELTIESPIIENLNDTEDPSTPIGFNIPFDYVLQNEAYFASVLEVEVDPETEEITEANLLVGGDQLLFNPVTGQGAIIVEKYSDGTGDIIFPFVGFNGTQVILHFEIL